MLAQVTGERRASRFTTGNVEIVCGTVDRFQGREADLVLLSMRNTGRVGFLDSRNRLNVAITRARQQLVILGKGDYFQHLPRHRAERTGRSAARARASRAGVGKPSLAQGGPVNAELVDDLARRAITRSSPRWRGWQPRPELRAICRLAREAGGPAHALRPSSRPCPGWPRPGADNMVRWCADLGLTDRHGGLTALGEETAESGEAPVPEQGLYDFWVDPTTACWGRGSCTPDRVQASPGQQHQRRAAAEIEPDHGRALHLGASPRSSGSSCGPFPSVSGLVGVRKRPTQARCELRWVLDWDQRQPATWTISGDLDGQRKSDGPRDSQAQA